MNAPANIRVNVSFPFPALVTGSGPVSLAKVKGIWTIGLSYMIVADQVPPPANWPNDYILVWDDINKVFFRVSFAELATIFTGGGSAGARPQRLVTASPILISPTDSILNCNIPANATCLLPASAGRLGAPLTFKDMGQATAHPIVITPAGAERIDGQPSLTINNNRQGVSLVPFNDGISTGWAIE